VTNHSDTTNGGNPGGNYSSPPLACPDCGMRADTPNSLCAMPSHGEEPGEVPDATGQTYYRPEDFK